MTRAAIALMLMLSCASAFGQEDQTPRPLKKDKRGLLQVNREYFDLAAATGGDFYFWAPGEFSAANLQIPVEHDEVVLAYGSLETRRVFDIPVESGVRSLEVFTGVQRKDLALLLRPDGVEVRERDEGTSVQSFQHMLIVTVRQPAAGTWRLELHGDGMLCVTAHVQPGENSPSLEKFNAETCKAGMFQAEFVARDGTTISRGDGCETPSVPFRVAITGVDANGKLFRRIERGLRQ